MELWLKLLFGSPIGLMLMIYDRYNFLSLFLTGADECQHQAVLQFVYNAVTPFMARYPA